MINSNQISTGRRKFEKAISDAKQQLMKDCQYDLGWQDHIQQLSLSRIDSAEKELERLKKIVDNDLVRIADSKQRIINAYTDVSNKIDTFFEDHCIDADELGDQPTMRETMLKSKVFEQEKTLSPYMVYGFNDDGLPSPICIPGLEMPTCISHYIFTVTDNRGSSALSPDNGGLSKETRNLIASLPLALIKSDQAHAELCDKTTDADMVNLLTMHRSKIETVLKKRKRSDDERFFDSKIKKT